MAMGSTICTSESLAPLLTDQRKRQYHIDVQVLNESGDPVVRGTFPRRAAAFEARQNNDDRRLPWRRLTDEFTSDKSCMSVQNAQPLSCEARILTRCSSDGSMLRWLVRASMAIIAFIALGEAL